MSDSSLLTSPSPAKEMKAAKKKVITLPPMLANAFITDVVLDKVMGQGFIGSNSSRRKRAHDCKMNPPC
jgi:hypothetical protein